MRLRAALSLLWIAAAARPAVAGESDATRALDDPRWEVRRRAEGALVTRGREALEVAASPGGDGAPLKEWSDVIGACLDGRSPTAAAAAERCLRLLETAED